MHDVRPWTFKNGRGPSSQSVRKVTVIKSKFSPHVTTSEHERRAESTDKTRCSSGIPTDELHRTTMTRHNNML